MVTAQNDNQDQAGQTYWNSTWDATPLPSLWPVDSARIRDHVERSLFEYLSEHLAKHGLNNQGKRLIEAGCARSAVLPLFATRLGFQVAGIDYSPNGCEQTRLMLQREGVTADVHCLDVFSTPRSLVEQFDVIVSFGLIEHFTDTAAIVRALARLVRPGGLIFTNVPNMCGVVGWTQRVLDKNVYRVHVPLTARQVGEAHRDAGLDVATCEYFLSTNFGVVNLNSITKFSAEWWIKKLPLALLVRLSMVVWRVERIFGRFPAGRAFSPYIHCVAVKPPRNQVA
jgi:2-polyprenyl-3-methyl-5-hydroxy-6-metoxy-1,4-benzoquinol methylase